ncbi:hypothetical protein G6F24_014033 [Rhizopus arrhizus]|nr:hypothetical protein G6F24_014033 [Rhizopus arrhizus]
MMTLTCCAMTSSAWAHACSACGVPHEGRASGQPHRPGDPALPPGRSAAGHAGRALAAPGQAVRAARLGRYRRTIARCAPAPGAAGPRADLRQVRPDPVDPPRPGTAGRGQRADPAAGPGQAVRWRYRAPHRRGSTRPAGERGICQLRHRTAGFGLDRAGARSDARRRPPGGGQGAAPRHREADRRRHRPAQLAGRAGRAHPSTCRQDPPA